MINIDLVYLWVDGDDPKWIAKRKSRMGDLSDTDEDCRGRYADNEELKYSLRSIEKYAPWIHQIFIVTDQQIPKWLDTLNPKIQIIDHSEILPTACIPCFNSIVIEHHLHKIPGLSEYFLYANDDMFLNLPVTPGDFFSKDLTPKIRLNHRPLRKWTFLIKKMIFGKRLSIHNQAIHNAALLVEKKYGTYYNGKSHHNIDAYLKSTNQYARQVFDQEISDTLSHHIRSPKDIQRSLYSYVALAEGRGHSCYVSQHTSFRLHIDNRKHYKKFERFNPMFFCMNDSEYANDDDRKQAATFLNKIFPDKSQFEK